MKVLHISTYDGGGAGKACLRLHRALLDKGIDSSVMVMEKTAASGQTPAITVSHRESIWQKIAIRLKGVHQKQMKLHALLKSQQVSFEYFSFADSIFSLADSAAFQQADVINLHWVADFMDFSNFFSHAKHKKIVWTLHDMNPFTGGCHYAGDCRQYERDCPRCPQLEGVLPAETSRQVWQQKSKILQQFLPDLHIVTPSSWLAECSQQSTLFQKFPHHVIANCLDTSIFKPVDKAACKAQAGIPADKRVLLFVSDKLHNYRKGFDLLLQSLQQTQWPEDVMLCSVGHLPAHLNPPTDIPHLNLGLIRDEQGMRNAYNAADLFVLPSREDNLPNVVLESLACGTPVAGFDIGGMKDMVQPGFNGLLAEEVSAAALARTIRDALSTPFDRSLIRQDAVSRYAPQIQAEAYLKVYKG